MIPIRTGNPIMIQVPYIKLNGPPKKKIMNTPTAINNIPAMFSRFQATKSMASKTIVKMLWIRKPAITSQKGLPEPNTSKENSRNSIMTSNRKMRKVQLMVLLPLMA